MAVALSAMVGLAGCDDSSDITESERPDINTDKTSLNFSVVDLGASSEELLLIENTGGADLTIHDFTISGEGAQFFRVNIEPDVEYDGRETVIAPLSEDPNAFLDIQVVYTPSMVGAANAVLTIHSDDPDESELEIQLVALEIGPQPQVVPNPIVFGQVLAGEEQAIEVTITNVGSAPLEMTRLSITGSPDFTPERGTRDEMLYETAPLAPDANTSVTIIYRPPTQSPDTGQFIIEYLFGSETRTLQVEMTANGNEPCVRVTPDVIDFGQAIIGQTSSMDVIIENCGNDQLELYGVDLTADTDPEFALINVPTIITDGGQDVLARGSTRTVTVTFAPTVDQQPYRGVLIVSTNDPAREILEVPINGVGTENNCPEAIALGQVIKSPPDPMSDQFNAEPLDQVLLSGAMSFDPDGDPIVEYQWTVVSAPDGFSLGFIPNNRSQDVQIQLALVGDYVFELAVFDGNGRESCVPGVINVRAQSDKALIVELGWQTPSDFDETDTCITCGTDLDLHMLNGDPNAYWGDRFGSGGNTGTDCHFNNKQPDWGAIGNANDDPSLDRDDTDGGGPEQINIREPAFTDGSQATGYSNPYLVGVYFYDSHGFDPPVRATIRVFLNAAQVPSATWPPANNNLMDFVVADPSGGRQGDFWLAGEIHWDSSGGSLTAGGSTVQTGFP